MEIILESGEEMKEPTKEAIIGKFEQILNGKISREEVSDWASEFIMHDEPVINDNTVWKLLKLASGVDLKVSPDEYLHIEQDIKDWIDKYTIR